MKFTIQIALLIGIAITGLFSCTSKPIELDYCTMIAEDQSFVNNDKSDLVEFNADKAKRRKLIESNFNLLMQKTKQDGFPFVSISNGDSMSCKDRAVKMTMLHSAQSFPDLFFGEKYAALFKKELDKGNIDRELMKIASILTARTIDLCYQLKPDIITALTLWGLNTSLFDEAVFVTCE